MMLLTWGDWSSDSVTLLSCPGLEAAPSASVPVPVIWEPVLTWTIVASVVHVVLALRSCMSVTTATGWWVVMELVTTVRVLLECGGGLYCVADTDEGGGEGEWGPLSEDWLWVGGAGEWGSLSKDWWWVARPGGGCSLLGVPLCEPREVFSDSINEGEGVLRAVAEGGGESEGGGGGGNEMDGNSADGWWSRSSNDMSMGEGGEMEEEEEEELKGVEDDVLVEGCGCVTGSGTWLSLTGNCTS